MATAELFDDDELRVETDWREQKLIEQVPGLNYRSRDRVWHGPISWSACNTLRGVFGEKLTVGERLQKWAWEQWHSWIEQNLRLRELIDDPLIESPDERVYRYQVVGSVFLSQTDALLCDDMGTGKSLTTLAALALRDEPFPALIICPNSVKTHWAREIATWLPIATPYVITGSAVQRRKLLEQVEQDPTAVAIMNYEAIKLHSRLAPYGSVRLIKCRACGGYGDDVPETKCQKHPKELNRINWRTIIVDEAHRMKDPKSQQTRACWAVQHQASVTRRWALTGTPIATDVGDLWSIMHGIAPDDFRVKSKFIDRFALLSWNPHAGLDIVGVRPDTRVEFEKIVHPRLRRMLKEIVLPDLPPKVRIIREAPMTTKQAKAYRDMEKELLAELEQDDGDFDVVIAKTNLTKAIRLLQFSSAYAQVEEDLTLKLSEPSPKLDVLEEILDELGDRQVAVCALSRQLIELAAVRLDGRGTTYRLLTGSVSEVERARNLQDFQEGKAQCMLFTVQAGGVGVSMTAADTIVFLQRSWSMIDNRQAEDRVHRVGSQRHESITIIDVVAPDTIEERQLNRLREKADQLEEVVRDQDRIAHHTISTSELGV